MKRAMFLAVFLTLLSGLLLAGPAVPLPVPPVPAPNDKLVGVGIEGSPDGVVMYLGGAGTTLRGYRLFEQAGTLKLYKLAGLGGLKPVSLDPSVVRVGDYSDSTGEIPIFSSKEAGFTRIAFESRFIDPKTGKPRVTLLPGRIVTVLDGSEIDRENNLPVIISVNETEFAAGEPALLHVSLLFRRMMELRGARLSLFVRDPLNPQGKPVPVPGIPVIRDGKYGPGDSLAVYSGPILANAIQGPYDLEADVRQGLQLLGHSRILAYVGIVPFPGFFAKPRVDEVRLLRDWYREPQALEFFGQFPSRQTHSQGLPEGRVIVFVNNEPLSEFRTRDFIQAFTNAVVTVDVRQVPFPAAIYKFTLHFTDSKITLPWKGRVTLVDVRDVDIEPFEHPTEAGSMDSAITTAPPLEEFSPDFLKRVRDDLKARLAAKGNLLAK